MLQKRKDIQWLRAFAILAVLGFHLMPKTFPYGYLGVDIFFVISGYLMTCILSKESEENVPFKILLLKFYSRRICRIFPSYFIVLGLTFILGNYLLLRFHFSFLSTEILWASFFATNLKSLFKKVIYFELTSEYYFCLHTWSLGVEIQFYIIAPFFLILILPSKASILKCCLFIIFSAGLQLYFSNNPISFDFFLCRLWQFLCGTLAFYISSFSTKYTLQQPLNNQPASKMSTYFYSILLIFLSLISFGPKYSMFSEKHELIFRFFATFLTAFLIFLGSNFQPNIPYFCNKIFTYLGDISYAVYLYHWPILLFAKYAEFDISNCFVLLGLLLLIFIISIVHYHLIETKLSKLSPSFNYWVIAILFGTILYFSIANYRLPPTTKKAFIDDASQIPLNDSEAIRINLEMATSCNQIPIKCEKDELLKESFKIVKKDDNFEGRCVLNLTENGEKTAIVIGNSYAMRHIDAIVTALNASKHSNTFSKIYLVSWKGCTVFESTFFEIPKIYECEKVKGLLIPFLQKLRPSLIIMINRLDFLPAFNTPFNATDPKFINFQNDFLTIANFSSQTIVIEPHHTVGATMKAAAITLATKISHKLSLSGLERNATDVHKELDLSWTKMKAAMVSCKNCHIFEILKYFCNKNICETFDKKNRLSYFCDGYHFTSVATKKFIDPLKSLINTLNF